MIRAMRHSLSREAARQYDFDVHDCWIVRDDVLSRLDDADELRVEAVPCPHMEVSDLSRQYAVYMIM